MTITSAFDQTQARPIAIILAFDQHETIAAVSGNHRLGLGVQQPGKYQAAPFGDDRCKARRKFNQRPGKYVGNQQVIGSACIYRRMIGSSGDKERHLTLFPPQRHSIGDSIVAGHINAHGIDVRGCHRRPRPKVQGRKCQQAGSSANIGDVMKSVASRSHSIDHGEATAGCFMPAGAKGLASLNQECLCVLGNGTLVSRRVDIKPAGFDRYNALLAKGQPVYIGQFFQLCFGAQTCFKQRDVVFARLCIEISLD